MGTRVKEDRDTTCLICRTRNSADLTKCFLCSAPIKKGYGGARRVHVRYEHVKERTHDNFESHPWQDLAIRNMEDQ